ncbi:MAG TPA: M23 family metallopeptidase [Gemmatimonadaceae bacterium]|jgi:biotin carboxyl carrier protein|nr:M23 family metallopeptidase [Gemmatimonadaceae bacterium]
MSACIVGAAGPTALLGQAQIPPSIEFRVPKAPTVANSDSGAFLAYELHVTNLTNGSMTLRRVEVLDAATGGSVIFTLADNALQQAVARPAPRIPAAERLTIGPGLRAYVYLWVPVDANHPPSVLRHRLTFQPADTGAAFQLEGTITPVTRTAVAISPPVQGEWVAINGPSNTSGHRRLVLALDGHVAIGQRFAIDYVRFDSAGTSHVGDPSNNSNYYAYGTELHAVADGVVAFVKDGIPQNVPGANSRAVPITMETVGGNHVAIDVGGGHFALYAHVQPGSIRVKVGDHVKRGQVVALLGNSGNSTEPHVHFQIADGPTFLSSEGEPYAFDFEVVGRCGAVRRPNPSAPGKMESAMQCTRHAPVHVRGIPLENEIFRFAK